MKLQNIVDCSNNDAIMSSIKCELKSCPNKAGWCYIVDNVHLKILPAHIKTWSIAINDGTATLDMPPTILVKSLMPAKQSLSNPMRDPYSKSSNSGSTPTPSSGTAVHVPAPTPPPQIIYQMMPHGYQHPYGLPTCYHGTPEPPQLHHDVRSSSVISGPDGLERLASYIHWLVRKNPTLATSLFEAKAALVQGDFIFDTVEHVTDDEFTKMAISPGIKVLLRTQIKRFKKAEAKGHM